ncbi:hypothetical protein KY345_06165 [Candidatus Woesearchaeota archaeon]|nr:hypothetical protein [Candidatus Woesearchaeota archaeon]
MMRKGLKKVAVRLALAGAVVFQLGIPRHLYAEPNPNIPKAQLPSYGWSTETEKEIVFKNVREAEKMDDARVQNEQNKHKNAVKFFRERTANARTDKRLAKRVAARLIQIYKNKKGNTIGPEAEEALLDALTGKIMRGKINARIPESISITPIGGETVTLSHAEVASAFGISPAVLAAAGYH